MPDQLAQEVQKQGVRLTTPRLKILQAMTTLPNQFTAGQLLGAASNVGRATVFRTLQLLCDIKVLEQVVLADGQRVYVQGHPPSHHHHLICNACGHMQDIHDSQIGELARTIALEQGFSAEEHTFEVYGLCPSCQDQRKQRP